MDATNKIETIIKVLQLSAMLPKYGHGYRYDI